MASNPIPSSQAIRLRLANSELGGISNLGAQIGLSVVTAPVMTGKISAFEAADSAVKSAMVSRAGVQANLNANLNAGMALAGVIKRYLADLPGFGTAPNPLWQQVGFAPHSLEIERKKIEQMLDAMRNYLIQDPSIEDPNRGVTAAHCQQVRQDIIDVRIALSLEKSSYAALKATEDAAFKALGDTMSALVKELKLHLGGDDARWYAFGLRRPDDPETPSAPHGLQLSGAGSGRVFADWDDVPGALRYHVWLAQGAQNPLRVASVDDSEFMLQDLIVGTQISVYIVASNDGGESVPSDAVTFSVV